MIAREGIAALPRRWLATALDALLPPRCLGCSAAVDRPGRLCPACWSAVDFIAPPFCACCGLPFEHEEGGRALCGACVGDPPPYDFARAVLRYGALSRGLVIAFKWRDQTHAAPAFAEWMARAAQPVIQNADWVTPVPLHRRRLFERRYNQAALLAREIGRLAGVPFAPDLLVRTRATPIQGGLTRRQRIDNLRGAIAVRPARRQRIEGRRIVLVDDVMTTGATAAACARALKRAGALRVHVVTLARVVPEGR